MNVVDMAIRVTLQDLASKALQGIHSQIGQVGSAAGTSGGKLTGLQKAGMVLGGVFLGSAAAFGTFVEAIKYSVEKASEYEQTMLKIQIATGSTKEQMKGLEPVLYNVADNSVYSVTQLGDGVVQLGRLGVSLDDLIHTKVIKSMKDLAEATGVDPVQAAKLLGTTLNEFGIKSKDAAATVDLLQFAMEHGVPDAMRLQEFLAKVGPTARMMGIPLNQVVATLDALGRTMGTSTDLGAGLQYMLQALSAPTGQQANALAQMGIVLINKTNPAYEQFISMMQHSSKQTALAALAYDGTVGGLQRLFTAAQKAGKVDGNKTFMEWATSLGIVNNKMYDSSGHFKDLVGNIHLLHDGFAKLDPYQQAQIGKMLFNVKSGTAARDLMSSLTSVDGLMKLLVDSHNNAGRAAALAWQQEHTFAGSLKVLKTTLDTLAATIGGPIRDKLAQFFGYINDNIMPGIVQWVINNKQMISNFLLLGAAISGVVMVISGLVLLIMFLMTPMGMVLAIAIATAAALTAMAAAGAWVSANWDMIMKSPIGKWITALQKIFEDIGHILQEVLTPIIHDLIASWNDLIVQIQPALPFLKFVGGIILGVLVASIIIGISMLVGMISFIAKFIQGVIQMVAGIIQFLTGMIKTGGDLFNMLIDLFTGNTTKLKQDFEQLKRDILSTWDGLWKAVSGLANATIGALIAYVWTFVKTVISFFTHLYDVLVGHSIVPDLLNMIFKVFSDILGNVTGTIGNFINGAIGLFQSLPGKIMDALSGLGSLLQSSGANMINMFGAGISGAMSAVTGPIQQITDTISGLLGHHSPAKFGPLSDDDKWMPNMINMFAGGIKGGIPTLKNATHELAANMAPGLQSAANVKAGVGLGGGGVQTYNLILDKKTLASFTMNQLTGQLTMNGAARMLL